MLLNTGRMMVLSFCLIISCAFNYNNYYSMGEKFLEQKNYDAAIQAFSAQLKKNINDTDCIRELGVAYYKKGEFKLAARLLMRHIKNNPKNKRALLYCSTAYEMMGYYKQAKYLYSKFIENCQSSDEKKIVEVHLYNLYRKQMRLEARDALAKEDSMMISESSRKKIAVLYFQFYGVRSILEPLSKGLTDLMIYDMNKLDGYGVVSRIKLQELMAEMGIDESGYLDDSICLRLGRLLGVSKVVRGVYTDVDNDSIKVSAAVISVANGNKIMIEEVKGKINNILKLEKFLLFKIFKESGIEITTEKLNMIRSAATGKYLAFVMYSAGLDFEDRGLFKKAIKCYKMAVRIDPKFMLARRNLKRTEITSLLKCGLFSVEELAVLNEVQSDSEYFSEKQEYTEYIADLLSSSFRSDECSGNTFNEDVYTNFGNSAKIRIQIAE